MTAFLRAWRLLLTIIGKVELALGSLLLISIGILISAQVVMRSLLNLPNSWTDEAAVYAFVWLAFIGASLAFKISRHITIQSFVGKLPPRLGNGIRLFVYACIIAISTILFFAMERATRMENLSTTIALPIRLPRSYFFSFPLRLSLFLIGFSGLYYAVGAALGIVTGEELHPIMSDDFLKESEEGGE